jgi:hypothetical protein
MPGRYAPAKTVYQEFRAVIGPWAKSSGFRRRPGAQLGWQNNLSDKNLLAFSFEGYSMVDPDVGSSLSGLVQLEPCSGPGSILRQSPFSCCLAPSELDALARLQGAINRRRPPIPWYLKKHFEEDSLLGNHLRELYRPDPAYQQGQIVSLAYFSLQDVQELAAFVVEVLPAALDRFLQGRVAKPIDTTPPHLKPKWLSNLAKRDNRK